MDLKKYKEEHLADKINHIKALNLSKEEFMKAFDSDEVEMIEKAMHKYIRKEGDKYVYEEKKGHTKKEDLADLDTPIANMLKDSKKEEKKWSGYSEGELVDLMSELTKTGKKDLAAEVAQEYKKRRSEQSEKKPFLGGYPSEETIAAHQSNKDTLGIKPEVYSKMVTEFKELSKKYNSKGVQGMLENSFQNVSLKKIRDFISQQSKEETMNKGEIKIPSKIHDIIEDYIDGNEDADLDTAINSLHFLAKEHGKTFDERKFNKFVKDEMNDGGQGRLNFSTEVVHKFFK